MSAKILQIQLHAPGATWFHDAGVAGLWMSLCQLEQKFPLKAQREGGLIWSQSANSIYLEWEGADFEVLDWLLKQSFRVSQEGLIELPGLKPDQMSIQAQLAVHRGITSTFLQHNKSVVSDGTDHIVAGIGDRTVKFFFKKVRSYAHQNFAAHLCDDQGNLQQEGIGVVGWLYPGLIVRHNAYREHTKFEETVERSLALLFAPLTCGYFALPSQEESARTSYVLVVPEIESLSSLAEPNWESEVMLETFSATCACEAGLKFLLWKFPTNSCIEPSTHRKFYVVQFGKTWWSPQQASRTLAEEFTVSKKALNVYQIIHKMLANLRTSSIETNNFLLFAPVRVAISNNLASGKLWWFNFFEQLHAKNALTESLKYTNLFIEMANQIPSNTEAEKLFIKACHEALRKTYAKVYDRTGENEIAQIDRKNQQILSRLKQCHNVDRFRSFIADFFAKAGIITVLQENQEELFPIIRGITDWRVSRDLFLLAMASYPRKKPSAENAEVQQQAAVIENK